MLNSHRIAVTPGFRLSTALPPCRRHRHIASPSRGELFESLSMTTFDRREEAFENLFAHDEEMRFKAEAHRAKLLGAWAASLMGKSGDAAEHYVDGLVRQIVTGSGEEGLFDRVRADLQGTAVTDGQIREQMHVMMAASIQYLKTA